MADDLWVVLPHLGAGGAQKVALLAAGHFADQGLSVRLITLTHGHPVVHALPPGVIHQELGPERQAGIRSFLQIHVLNRLIRNGLLLLSPWLAPRICPGRGGVAWQLFRYGTDALGGERLQQLKRLMELERPHRVLALLGRTNIRCCLAAWDLPLHLVVSERNDPARQRLDRFWSWLRTLSYQRADVVTANAEGVVESLRRMGRWKRLELLPNPLPSVVHELSAADSGGAQSTTNELQLLTVARLVRQKGLDVLIDAFAALNFEQRVTWRLIVAGDGPERQALEAQAQRLGVANQIDFLGFHSDPASLMRKGGVFVLPSRYEGMPNALLEAMGFALPVVITDVSPGPLEVVTDGVEGLVVPGDDVEALKRAISRLINDPTLRLRLGEAGRKRLQSLEWPQVEAHWRSVLNLTTTSLNCL